MIINKSGITIRQSVSDIGTYGRSTQGVRLIKLKKGDSIASLAKIDVPKEEEIEEAIESDSSDDLAENTNTEAGNLENTEGYDEES